MATIVRRVLACTVGHASKQMISMVTADVNPTIVARRARHRFARPCALRILGKRNTTKTSVSIIVLLSSKNGGTCILLDNHQGKIDSSFEFHAMPNDL